MSRVKKLYATLDALVDDYKNILGKEFKRKDFSFYLYKSRNDIHPGRQFCLHGKANGLDEANDALHLEKQLRQLCEKMGEPLPLPLRVLEEYVATYLQLKEQKTKVPWLVEDFESEHKSLKKKMIEKLDMN